MRKSLLIIMAVAVLGGLGLYINRPDNKPNVIASSTTASTATDIAQTTGSSSQPSTGTSTSSTAYNDGTYTGSQADTLYGTVQVAAVISNGKITDIQFLKMPNDQENSKVIASIAEPQLKSEALSKQSAQIDFVSGATQDSQGFEQSLQNALNQAAS